ncbi:methionine--tRNA ligase [Prochlorothrix hollandica]|uniref:methionine--tRNA ligase n=1 Tax=Prochlorothrix hollandica TaxID=1223 RepID=UPI00333E6725
MNAPSKPFAITTPLYYVNTVPHIGSAYTTIAADALSRFHRLQGHPTLFITGTDEHGQKIQRMAEQRQLSPQEHCDEIVGGFKTLWDKLLIRYDRFSRTTDPRHETIVGEFFQRVKEQGDIYLGQQQGWYCVACEEFKEERELLDGDLPEKRCPIHSNQSVEWRDERNYFFRLSKYQAALEALYDSQPDFIQPPSRRNEVLSFVKRGLQDFSISRINLDWGFPVPGDPEHTLYVWFDALLGYVTALLEPDDEVSLDRALAQWWPINLHLIGKDILRFHAVYWPAMLMSAGLPLPDRVFGHGFLTKDGQKMGKSLGNTLDPVALVDTYGADAVRYYFLKEIEFGRDGDFQQTRFVHSLNADLANDLGNLLNRTLTMAKRYCQQQVPALSGADFPADHPLKQVGQSLQERVPQAYHAVAFSVVCEGVLELVRLGNKYLDREAPWSRYKAGDQAAVEQILYGVLESVRLGAYWLSPIIPSLSTAIYQQLGFSVDFNDFTNLHVTLGNNTHHTWGILPGGQPLQDPTPIFRTLDLPEGE